MQTPILMYHSVGDERLPHAVDAAMFAKQMEFLAGRGYRSVSVAELGVERGRALALTFDDGYADNLYTALPTLRRFGFRATVFVVSDFVDAGKTPWEHDSLSWAQCRELQGAGIEIGSHTCSHPDLRTLAGDELRREIAGSKQRIEDMLGGEVRTFAYPSGYVSEAAVEAVQAAGYQFACAVRLPKDLARGSHTMQRIAITSRDDMRRFRVKLSLAYRWLIDARLEGVLNRLSR